MGKIPGVTAVGYTNSVAAAKETVLYDIDAAHALLVRQAPPNDGILVTVGAAGREATAVAGLIGRIIDLAILPAM